MKKLLVCKCGDTPKFAKESFALLFPDTPTPDIVSGGGAINALADSLPKSEASQYLKGLSHNKERYAIYLEWDDDGHIVTAYNLLTGRRIQ